jgi:hypothetical protein
MTTERSMHENAGNGTAMVSAEPTGLVMVASLEEAKERLRALQDFVAAIMVDGVDYGEIPGTSGGGKDDKPRKSLLQPGAQKLEEVYGLTHTFEIEKVEDFAKPFFHYSVRCVLRRGERYVGDGHGSCNSMEARYAYRWVWPNDVPVEVDKSTLRTRTFRSRDKKREFVKYKLPNDDIFSLVNTILKMGCKRALVHAVIGVTRSSGIFTQDVEDLPPEHRGERTDVPEAEFWESDDTPSPPEPATAAEWAKLFDAAKTPNELKALGKRANGKDVDDREKMEASYKANVERLKGAK